MTIPYDRKNVTVEKCRRNMVNVDRKHFSVILECHDLHKSTLALDMQRVIVENSKDRLVARKDIYKRVIYVHYDEKSLLIRNYTQITQNFE